VEGIDLGGFTVYIYIYIQCSPFITPSLGPAIILALGGGGVIEGVVIFLLMVSFIVSY